MIDINHIINTVFCADCIEFMKTIPDKSIELNCTDAPYQFISKGEKQLTGGGFMVQHNKRHIQSIKNTFGINYDPIQYLNECKRICKIFNGYFFTNKTLLKDYIGFAEENKYNWELMIYSKSNPCPLNKNHYLFDKEYAVFIKDKGATFNSNLGYNKYFTVQKYSIQNKSGHPTEKPLNMIKGFIEVSSNKNDIVFDGYIGSGTTAIACIETGRNFIGCEIHPDYHKMALSRISTLQQQPTLNF